MYPLKRTLEAILDQESLAPQRSDRVLGYLKFLIESVSGDIISNATQNLVFGQNYRITGNLGLRGKNLLLDGLPSTVNGLNPYYNAIESGLGWSGTVVDHGDLQDQGYLTVANDSIVKVISGLTNTAHYEVSFDPQLAISPTPATLTITLNGGAGTDILVKSADYNTINYNQGIPTYKANVVAGNTSEGIKIKLKTGTDVIIYPSVAIRKILTSTMTSFTSYAILDSQTGKVILSPKGVGEFLENNVILTDNVTYDYVNDQLIKRGSGVKILSGFLTQASTDAPSIVDGVNEIGVVTGVYVDVGTYLLHCVGGFPAGKTSNYSYIDPTNDLIMRIDGYGSAPDDVEVRTYTLSGTPTNAKLTSQYYKIEVSYQ